MPHIISESGRALTAHHALLLLKVIDVESQADDAVPELTDDDHALLHEMAADYATRREARVAKRACARSTTTRRSTRSARRSCSTAACSRCATARWPSRSTSRRSTRSRAIAQQDRDEYEDIIDDLDATLVDRYFCNFSLFQSLPDSWAIDQLFPIMPIHRLNEEPTRRGTIQDVTCDSDGKIDRFVGDKDGEAEPRAARVPRRRAVHARHLPHGRVPGDPRRPAQPVRRHERRAHPAVGDRRLRGHRSRARRHGDRGAQLRAVPRVRSAADVPPQGARGEASQRGRRRTRSSPTTSRGSKATRTSRARRRSDARSRRAADAGAADAVDAAPRGAGRDLRRDQGPRRARPATRTAAVLGELIAGILLGGSALGIVDPSNPVITVLAEIGVIVLLFETGLHTELRSLLSVGSGRRRSRWPASSLPFALGFVSALALGARSSAGARRRRGAVRHLGRHLGARAVGSRMSRVSRRARRARRRRPRRHRRTRHPRRRRGRRHRGRASTCCTSRGSAPSRFSSWRRRVRWDARRAAGVRRHRADQVGRRARGLRARLRLRARGLAKVVGSALIIGAFAAGLVLYVVPQKQRDRAVDDDARPLLRADLLRHRRRGRRPARPRRPRAR